MNDAISLLITTTCLAVVGMGIYLFSSDSSDETTSTKQTQKGGKKTSHVSDNHNHHNDNNNNNDDQNIHEIKEIISEPEHLSLSPTLE
jgi:anti-sigma28 factor (negative regulator of flagellin synthesis)